MIIQEFNYEECRKTINLDTV